jgi:hypothetical protein
VPPHAAIGVKMPPHRFFRPSPVTDRFTLRVSSPRAATGFRNRAVPALPGLVAFVRVRSRRWTGRLAACIPAHGPHRPRPAGSRAPPFTFARTGDGRDSAAMSAHTATPGHVACHAGCFVPPDCPIRAAPFFPFRWRRFVPVPSAKEQTPFNTGEKHNEQSQK